MKTLIVSMYDGITTCSAAVIEDTKFKNIEISNNLYHIIYDSSVFHNELLDPSWQKKIKRLIKLYGDYDHVILCIDGNIKRIK